MSKTVQEKLKNETNPYVISTLLMADEAGIEVSDIAKNGRGGINS